jgi:hypothetical protein
VAELEREVADHQEKHRALTGTSQEMLWLSDLRTFRTAYDVYVKAREDSYASAAATAAVDKTPKKRAAPKKKA